MVEEQHFDVIVGGTGLVAAQRHGPDGARVMVEKAFGSDLESAQKLNAAVRLTLDSWRWSGVPIVIRAGKAFPMPCCPTAMPGMTRPSENGASRWAFACAAR